MMAAVDKHRKYVEQSGIYYRKKIEGGEKYNQAMDLTSIALILVTLSKKQYLLYSFYTVIPAAT